MLIFSFIKIGFNLLKTRLFFRSDEARSVKAGGRMRSKRNEQRVFFIYFFYFVIFLETHEAKERGAHCCKAKRRRPSRGRQDTLKGKTKQIQIWPLAAGRSLWPIAASAEPAFRSESGLSIYECEGRCCRFRCVPPAPPRPACRLLQLPAPPAAPPLCPLSRTLPLGP